MKRSPLASRIVVNAAIEADSAMPAMAHRKVKTIAQESLGFQAVQQTRPDILKSTW